jgi:predicted nucleotidyltransferase/Arc/MetJ family transcription regulator
VTTPRAALVAELTADLTALAEQRAAVEAALRRALLRAASEKLGQALIAEAMGVSQPAVSQAITTARKDVLGRTAVGRAVLEHRRALLDVAKAHGARDVRVVGAAARGEDGAALELLVRLTASGGPPETAALAAALADLLGLRVVVAAEHLLDAQALAARATDAVPL